MANQPGNYNMPKGYNGFFTLLRSYKFLHDPVQFVCDNMQLRGGTYSARLPQYPNFILTQDAGFINYVLRDNHSNYSKSELSSGRLAQYVGKGMLFENGETWLRQRRLVQPAFHREKLQNLFKTVVAAVQDSLAEFKTGGEVNVYPEVYQLSFNVIIKSLFDIDLSKETMKKLSDDFSDIQDFVVKDVNQPFRRPFYSITGAERRTLRKSAATREIFREIIKQRRQGSGSHNDLLDMLLGSTYEDTGLPMDEDKVIDELIVLMFAGHETTANALSWLLYLLAANPGVLQKLTETVLQTDVFSMPRNEYVTAVINEGMRIYPAAWLTDREALSDDAYGGYTYPKGTVIVSFLYGAHHDKTQWADAEAFNPERFLDEAGRGKKFKNFFPFGAGPRLCIGNNFAMAEMAFFLHAFLRKFTIKPTAQVPKMKPLLTLRPDKVVLEVRAIG